MYVLFLAHADESASIRMFYPNAVISLAFAVSPVAIAMHFVKFKCPIVAPVMNHVEGQLGGKLAGPESWVFSEGVQNDSTVQVYQYTRLVTSASSTSK